ncbi:MAG: RNA polymerase sigma factor [Eubacterium sp.]
MLDFESLYKTYYMKVYSYVMTLVKNADAAEEITQKAFFKAINSQKRQKFRGQSSEYTWLVSIAKNLAMDYFRAQKKRAEMPEEEPPDPHPAAETQTEQKDTALRIHLLLHQMKEPYKEVFQLRVFGELSFRDIGMIFSKTENWARVTYHRAKLKLQEQARREESASAGEAGTHCTASDSNGQRG